MTELEIMLAVPGCGNIWHWRWNSKENYRFALHETPLACQTQSSKAGKCSDEERWKSLFFSFPHPKQLLTINSQLN